MTPARITILVLGIVAILMIAGAIFGGLGNYERLRESADAAAAAAASAPRGRCKAPIGDSITRPSTPPRAGWSCC